MKKFLLPAAVLALAGWLFAQAPGDAPAPSGESPRFETVAVFVETGDAPLAAWQAEVRASSGGAKLSGVEGGEHPAFAQPPYYDPAALRQGRVILAAFHTGKDLPAGRVRVATLHWMVDGASPDYAATLSVAAGEEGKSIEARIVLEKGGSQ